MRAVYLPGSSKVAVLDVPAPRPGPGQAVVAVEASTICGSDLRAIYREHLGHGPEGYTGVIAGHEPCGEVVETGPDCHSVTEGDRVVVYHISGCGHCEDCRRGYMISCTSPDRRAYGWQRDGGHAELLLADETDLLALPAPLTFIDGACVACGFGTAYEALCRAQVSARDNLAVVGLGPVGLAVGLLGKALGVPLVMGIDPSGERRGLALRLGAVDLAGETEGRPATGHAGGAGHAGGSVGGGVNAVLESTAGRGVEVAVDCSGSSAGQTSAVAMTARWGRTVMVGEGGHLSLDVSQQLIHRDITLIGSWVTSVPRMAELLDRLVRWKLHPQTVVTHRFGLEEAGEAYATADRGYAGKVAILPRKR